MPVVKVEKLATKNPRQYIGCITLNRPEALNALNLEMLKIIHSALCQWRTDDSVVAIFIDAQDEKAFCAGGDVVALYNGMLAIKAAQAEKRNNAVDFELVPKDINDFFIYEYQTDFMVHTYPKPVVAWGNGYIMGGGMGIYSGADIKIATENTKMAMPEVSIGLFPDVGASYFLNQLPNGIGMFMGLTGVQLNAKDAFDIKMCTHIVDSEKRSAFKMALLEVGDYSTSSLTSLADEVMKLSCEWQNIQAHFGKLENYEVLDNVSSLLALKTNLHHLIKQNVSSKWHVKAFEAFERASPTAIAITHRQLNNGKNLSIAKCFEQETNMVFQSLFNGEFCEGVRALLIDKDKTPKWQFDTPESVPNDIVDSFFEFFGDQSHPLFSLEKDFN